MDVDAVEVFTAVLALGAALLAVVVVVGRLLRRSVPAIDVAMTAVDDAAVWSAWLIAAAATAGSLYFSEVADFAPCRLCWFQRIAMYPLSAILLIGAARRDRAVRWYALPFVVVGACLSTYHYAIEWKPSLEGGACGIGPPCSGFYFREFGFVTLAFMALCGFVAIGALLFAPGSSTWEPDDPADRPDSAMPTETSAPPT